MAWEYETFGPDGQCKLFGVNIFDYDWQTTGKRVKIKDPIYHQDHTFEVWQVEIDGQIHRFAAGEFSNCVWGILFRERRMKGVCGRMSRIVDKPYFTYSAYNALTSGIQVKCPKCHGAGVVTADEDNAYFRCLSCGHQETRDRTIYRYDVHNQCKNCGRYYRVDIEDEAKQQFSVLHVACPYCGTTMSGEVHKTAEAFSYIGEIRDGREPYFGLELWFLTSFQGKPVWALNREHLAYLIGYLSADLREKPPGRAKMTQADHLPTFMKTAKNRERIVKLLRQMQEK